MAEQRQESDQGESIQTLLNKSGNSLYKLVVIASKRALELAEGKPKLIENVSIVNTKPSTIALREISQGKVTLKTS
ncbi:MAG: DNA-directed RNA polymerase subunit omega [Deltaproteobacteria bacterium]